MVTSHLGSVAQLVERSTENRKVTGSTPVGATTGKHQFFENWCFSSLTPSPAPLYRRGRRAARGGRRRRPLGGRPAGRARLARWGKTTKAAGSPVRAGGAISTEK